MSSDVYKAEEIFEKNGRKLVLYRHLLYTDQEAAYSIKLERNNGQEYIDMFFGYGEGMKEFWKELIAMMK